MKSNKVGTLYFVSFAKDQGEYWIQGGTPCDTFTVVNEITGEAVWG